MANKVSFQVTKKSSGGMGPYQIESNVTGTFQAGVQGLVKETMEEQMTKLVNSGLTVIGNEHFKPKPRVVPTAPVKGKAKK